MLKDFLRLVRLPNLFTAVADIFAGHFIAAKLAGREGSLSHLLLLSTVSAGLYAAGVALNDLVDLYHDRTHNPNRPLPAGRVRPIHALILIGVLFTFAILLAQLVSMPATVNAMAIVLLIFAYNGYSKRLRWTGPVNMALIRCFNVLLGMQVLPTTLVARPAYLPLPLVMLCYIAMLTFISLSEEVSPKVKAAVKYLVLGIVAVDGLMLLSYGLYLASGVTLLLIIPPAVLSRRFYLS